MNRLPLLALFACVTFLFVAAVSSDRQQQQRQPRVSLEPASRRAQINKRADPANKEDWQENNIPDEPTKNQNETRIIIGEPYKSIIQTTTRFALAQSRLTKHLNIDSAMNILNEVALFLAKPIVLLKTIKLATVTLATLFVTLFLFPGSYKFMETAWQDPMEAFNLDHYLTNGMQARSVSEVVGSKTDEMLSRVGLQDDSCRQKSLCYLGEITKCSFPRTAETITKFASENFAESNIKENVYARAFISGFVDRNCAAVGTSNSQEARNCLGNFFNSILSGQEVRK